MPEKFKILPNFDNMGKSKQTKISRWTSLEQLSLAEFSGELVRPKVYEYDHKSVLGIWNGRSNIAQFWFSKSFFYVKNQPNLSDFFSLRI